MRDEKVLLRGIGGVGGLKLLASVAAVLTTLLLARLLTPAGFGDYAFAFSVATLVTLPVLQGLPVLVLREVARASGGSPSPLVQQLLRYSNRLVLAVGLLLVLILGASIVAGQGVAWRSDPLLALTALALPLVMVATLVRGSVIRGYGRAVAGQFPDLLLRPFVFLALLAVLWLQPVPSAGVAMSLHLAGAIVALFAAIALMPRGSGALGGPDVSLAEAGAWTRTLLPLSTLGGMQLINSQVDLVLLGMLGEKQDVGIYKLATTLALQVSFMLTLVNAVVAPRFAALHSAGKLSELKKLNRLSALLAFSFGLIVFLAFVLVGRPLIVLTVGEAYLPAFAPLMVLSVAQVISLPAGTTNVLLNMIGHEKDVLKAVLVALPVNLVLSMYLIPRFGMLGAACSSAASLMAWRGLLSWFLRRRLTPPKGA